MGVNIHVYTIYGIRNKWDNDFFEKYDDVREALVDEFGYDTPIPSDQQVDVLIDGMSGEYMYFGKIMYDSGDFRYFDNMNDYQEHDLSQLEAYKQNYIEQFRKIYPDHMHLLEGKEWKLINLIFYS